MTHLTDRFSRALKPPEALYRQAGEQYDAADGHRPGPEPIRTEGPGSTQQRLRADGLAEWKGG